MGVVDAADASRVGKRTNRLPTISKLILFSSYILHSKCVERVFFSFARLTILFPNTNFSKVFVGFFKFFCFSNRCCLLFFNTRNK